MSDREIEQIRTEMFGKAKEFGWKTEVDLRGGGMVCGRITAFNGSTVTVEGASGPRTINREDIHCVQDMH